MNFCFATILALIFHTCHIEGKLPDFITPCHLSQPKLGKCIYERAKEALPHIIKGVPELNIPPLAKLKLPTLTTSYESIAISLDGYLEGLANIGYKHVTFDRIAQRGTAQMIFPSLNLTGKYSVNGIIGDKELIREGDIVIIFIAPHYDYNYVLEKFEKNGSIYYREGKLELTAYKVESAKYEFTTLSDGNEAKGEEVEDYFGDNWETLHELLGRVLAQNVLTIVYDVVNKFLETAPVNEIFLP